eukprot:TRINITY_DN10207_c0_g1_i1.p1 TRINITY_DN10207_c0_g1~~TRINITY_DN10207_c0_g1_i1.p1  ORF type:complete len:211 (+),score=51.55 TRINITY_DN10207_c0_g1_i1:42-674(+)
MQSLLFLCCIAACAALGFTNSQVSQIPIYSKSGHIVGMTDPRTKFAPTYVQELDVWHDNVLLSLEQANQDYEWNGQLATVVKVGPSVSANSKALLVEGATVLVDSTCTAVWTTTAAFTAAYPLHTTLANAMVGKYVNGVSLNNGWGWTLNDRTDVVNSNQQYNYLACKEANIVGVISEETWGANRADKFTSRILKPAFSSDIYPEFWFSS